MKFINIGRYWGASLFATASFQLILSSAQGQDSELDEIYELTPFEVTADQGGYVATSTLAGSRLNTEMRDIGTAVQAITKDFMDDIGATDNQSLLQYTTNTEVAGPNGNFSNTGGGAVPNEAGSLRSPHESTRVRGLQQADNTRDFYQTLIPWDGYNVERVDIQRGANSILFGLGSPAGIINADLADANYYGNTLEVGIGTNSFGSMRLHANINRVLIEDQLAIRVAALNDREKFKREPAFKDDDRIYVAARYEPAFLKSDRARTILKVKYEDGERSQMYPRSLPPMDLISPFFQQRPYSEFVDADVYDEFVAPVLADGFTSYQASVIPQEANDSASKLPGRGANRRQYDDGSANPYYNPFISILPQVFGGALIRYDDASSGAVSSVERGIIDDAEFVAPAGSTVTNINGLVNGSYKALPQFPGVARELGLPAFELGAYKNTFLTDSSVFDFYNHEIDGPNRGTLADFDAFNIALEQTFFNDNLGFTAVLDEQTYSDEQRSFVNSWKLGVGIDINERMIDGSVNPNYGRPFLTDSHNEGNSEGTTENETMRFSGYYNLKFNELLENPTLGKILGRQVFNVAYSNFERNSNSRGFPGYVSDGAYGNLIGQGDFAESNRHVNQLSYLGPSLAGRSSLAGANIPGITARQTPSGDAIRLFDATWTAPGVDPASAWTSPFDGVMRTQADNPANYAGFRDFPFGVDSANDDPALRDAYQLATGSTLLDVKSNIAVWQGYFLNGAIAPMYGYREDTVTAAAGIFRTDGFELDSNSTPLEEEGELETKSLVVHVDELLDVDKMPFKLSLFMNESENFNPSDKRVDVFGQTFPSPSGVTEDQGFLISTKDDRFSARVTWYESDIQKSTNRALDDVLWAVGEPERWAMAQAVNIRYENTPGSEWSYMPKLEGESDEDHLQRRIDHTQVIFDNLPPKEFLTSFGIPDISTTEGVEAFQTGGGHFFPSGPPAGFTTVTDLKSEGLELELYGSITDNWSFALNASKSEASFSNIAQSLFDFLQTRREDWDQVGPNGVALGDINLFSIGSGNDTLRGRFTEHIVSPLNLQRLQEGSSVSELREWRANLVTNYTFSDGALKGFRTGMGYRWQDDVVIGYRTSVDADGSPINVLDDPFKGPAESNFDFWVGYSRPLANGADWKIQFNIYNAFSGNDLIPLNVQENGTPAAYRIAPSRAWSLSNTLSF